MISKEDIGLPLFIDPMVAETNLYDSSQHMRLSDPLLRHNLRFIERQVRPRGLYARELRTHRTIFPEIARSLPLPDVWRWDHIVTKAENLGTVEDARRFAKRGRDAGVPMAYITGGLEFTRGQLRGMLYLLRKGYRIIMGHEPYVYPAGKGKRFGAITVNVVPMSYWSKVLRGCGMVFTIPRPLPVDASGIDAFYDSLYERITGRKIPIIVSQSDPFVYLKQRRGPTVQIPHFDRPSTTDLWNSLVR